MENVWLLQLPEEQLVLLGAIEPAIQQQRPGSWALDRAVVGKPAAPCRTERGCLVTNLLPVGAGGHARKSQHPPGCWEDMNNRRK